MIDVSRMPEDIESQWHVKLQRKLQERIRRWLGISQVEADVGMAVGIAHETSKVVRKLAEVQREDAKRLNWHESHSEVMRMSASSYEKHKRNGFKGENDESSKILLLDRFSNGNRPA